MTRPRIVAWLHRHTSTGAWCERFHAKQRVVRAWPVQGCDGVLVTCTACSYSELTYVPEIRA